VGRRTGAWPAATTRCAPPAGGDRAPKSGWASLTEAETAVANLAAQGSTNRQIADKVFISQHTVNTHLRHVFEKLGVNSRMHLMRVVESQHDGS
jgi:DNA-binding CsgD family transcriptional regulator